MILVQYSLHWIHVLFCYFFPFFTPILSFATVFMFKVAGNTIARTLLVAAWISAEYTDEWHWHGTQISLALTAVGLCGFLCLGLCFCAGAMALMALWCLLGTQVGAKPGVLGTAPTQILQWYSLRMDSLCKLSSAIHHKASSKFVAEMLLATGNLRYGLKSSTSFNACSNGCRLPELKDHYPALSHSV